MNLATGRSAFSSHLQVSLSHRVSPFGSSHLQRIRFPLLTEQTPPCDTSRQRLSERVSVCLPSMMAMQITYVRVNSRHVPLVPLITAAARTIPHSSLPCIVENMQKDLGQNDKQTSEIRRSANRTVMARPITDRQHIRCRSPKKSNEDHENDVFFSRQSHQANRQVGAQASKCGRHAHRNTSSTSLPGRFSRSRRVEQSKKH